jgi:threonine/homoserine/homoserine lactone efflux protein
MAKTLTVLGMVIAVLVLGLFALDLAIKIPFERVSVAMDCVAIVGAGILGYLSWSTYKEQV